MTPPDRLAAFRAETHGIRTTDAPEVLRARSGDYHWYSPVLKALLDDKRGELLVSPADEAEVVRVAAAAARARIPVTLRGGGTGNYGQCVPMEGGIVLDLTRLDRIVEIGPGRMVVEGGARIEAVEAAAQAEGQALLMYPSTKRQATIGGFVAGGSGGIGSLRHGMLRDPGSLLAARVLTLEEEPRVLSLEGAAVDQVQHAYGTNGIILDLALPLVPATGWLHGAALVDGYEAALRLALAAEAEGLDCYLLTVVERRFAPFYRKLGDLFPEDRDAVFAMVAPEAWPAFEALAARFGGRVSYALDAADLAARGLPPAYECGWNHTTLMAIKADPGWTYLQVAYPQPFDPALVLRQMARHGERMRWHHETARMGGGVQVFALPILRWEGEPALRAVMAEIEADGCTIYDPHALTVEDGGMKEIDGAQIAFKREADPHGLLNPGKTRGWTADMARP